MILRNDRLRTPINRAIGLFALILLSISGPLAVDPASADHATPADPALLCGDHIPHPPIFITTQEDAGPGGVGMPLGFTSGEDPVTGRPIYRPGSGVTSGNGTAEDPFVIEGWCILPAVLAFPSPIQVNSILQGIHILGAEGHLIIRDNVVAGHLDYAIYLDEVDPIVVDDNLITLSEGGIMASHAPGLIVRNNTITHNEQSAIYVTSSAGNLIEGNLIAEQNWFQVYMRSDDATIRGNVIRDGGFGIVHNGDRGMIIGNHVVDNMNEPGTGIAINSGDQAVVRDNVIRGNSGVGLSMRAGSVNGLVENNILADNGIHDGLADMFIAGHRHILRNNSIESHVIPALRVSWSATGTQLYGNDISGAMEFLEGAYLRDNNLNTTSFDAIRSSVLVDAVGNWWGCPDGPNAPGCPEATGHVVYDPWLTEPVEGAGATG